MDTGGINKINLGLDQGNPIYCLKVVKTANYQANLLVLATGRNGMEIFDCNTLERIHNYRAKDENFLQLSFISQSSIILSGTNKGIIRMHEASDINRLLDIENHYTQSQSNIVKQITKLTANMTSISGPTTPRAQPTTPRASEPTTPKAFSPPKKSAIEFNEAVTEGLLRQQSTVINEEDFREFPKDPNDDKPIWQELCTLDADIRYIEVSPKPEEKYLAAGTEKGTVHIFEMKFILERKVYQYATFNFHKVLIRGLNFIKTTDDYLLVSYCEDGHFNVVCLKERVLLYSNESIPGGVAGLLYNDQINKLIIRTKTD